MSIFEHIIALTTTAPATAKESRLDDFQNYGQLGFPKTETKSPFSFPHTSSFYTERGDGDGQVGRYFARKGVARLQFKRRQS